jgi:ribosomal-protein-serine acetyltransferase
MIHYEPIVPHHARHRYKVVQQNIASLMPYFSWCANTSFTQARCAQWVQQASALHQRKKGYFFGIWNDSQYIGEIGIDAIYTNNTTNVYYWVARNWHKKGIATNALRWFKKWVCKNHPHLKLYVRININNIGSQRVAEKAGGHPFKTKWQKGEQIKTFVL